MKLYIEDFEIDNIDISKYEIFKEEDKSYINVLRLQEVEENNLLTLTNYTPLKQLELFEEDILNNNEWEEK